MNQLNQGETLKKAALKADIDPKTAAKYRDGYEPSENLIRSYSTRQNPFNDDWELITDLIGNNEGLEAKTIFDHLQSQNPGRYQDGQIRTLQRHIKEWRGQFGQNKEVIFPQTHPPGELGASDFTSMNELKITIAGQLLEHKLFHFVLTHSNWEAGSICYSESFASLSSGIQNALWELGAVPKFHLTDSLSAAVNNHGDKREFTRAYDALMKYYKLNARKTQPRKPNENGDVEQANFRFKKALDQSLMLRGSRDFSSIIEYEAYLKIVFRQLNSGRTEALKRELEVMHDLPAAKLDVRKKTKVKVSNECTIRIERNTYSVQSKLIGEKVDALIGQDKIEVYYASKLIETIPRLLGRDRHCVNYRHIIDSLIRKPGAFENYKYRESMFPSTHFRIAYDELIQGANNGLKTYLKILNLAAKTSEEEVENSLIELQKRGQRPSVEIIEHLLEVSNQLERVTDVDIPEVDLGLFDQLLDSEGLYE